MWYKCLLAHSWASGLYLSRSGMWCVLLPLLEFMEQDIAYWGLHWSPGWILQKLGLMVVCTSGPVIPSLIIKSALLQASFPLPAHKTPHTCPVPWIHVLWWFHTYTVHVYYTLFWDCGSATPLATQGDYSSFICCTAGNLGQPFS